MTKERTRKHRICEVCGKHVRGNGELCYEHRRFEQYSGFTHLRYCPPKRQKSK